MPSRVTDSPVRPSVVRGSGIVPRAAPHSAVYMYGCQYYAYYLK